MALVAQWTEQIRPKDKMGVRFFPRAYGPIVKRYYEPMAWASPGFDSP